ncbi:MAG TPA: GNAT family N-acetyltransferase [Planctomycetes bacterium]|nr:GNAT family N-acetyltransferase [Planctomycetota bacterium]
MQFRDFVPADLEEVFSFARALLDVPPFDGARRELSRYPRHDLVAKVAVGAEGRIVGFCAATHPYWNAIAMVDYLVVEESHRKRGVGRELLQSVEAELVRAGLRGVCVQTALWNEGAIRFYERLDYERLAVLPEYFGSGNDAVWLHRRFPHGTPRSATTPHPLTVS